MNLSMASRASGTLMRLDFLDIILLLLLFPREKAQNRFSQPPLRDLAFSPLSGGSSCSSAAPIAFAARRRICPGKRANSWRFQQIFTSPRQQKGRPRQRGGSGHKLFFLSGQTAYRADTKRRSMVATSARVALPEGSNRPSFPPMIPAPQAHCMASMAYSDTWKASA